MIKAQVKELVLLRASKGWSKTDLAKNAGVSSSLVSRVEKGGNTSAKAAKKIADALQVEVSEIFTILND